MVAFATIVLQFTNLVVSFWSSRTCGQLFDYGFMSNPDVFVSLATMMNHRMAYFTSASVCKAFLFHIKRTMIMAGVDWFSYPFPVALCSWAFTVSHSHKYTSVYTVLSHAVSFILLVDNKVWRIERQIYNWCCLWQTHSQHITTLDHTEPFDSNMLCVMGFERSRLSSYLYERF